MKKGIDTYTIAQLDSLMASLGQPRFRAQQLFEWLYGHGATSYEAMTNLPAGLRDSLTKEAPLHVPSVVDKRVSADGTRKYILELHDGALAETVGIPSGGTSKTAADSAARDHDADERPASHGGNAERLSVCVSSQVGCAMACSFCATGQEGFTRNLSMGEIVWQVLCVAKDFGARVSNVVLMGQGEPFLNFDNCLEAMRVLNHPKGPGIGARHIAVSTCGILDGIRRLSQVDEQFVLAVSLHSAIQSVRDVLMPRCSATPLVELKDALAYYQAHAGRRISFEYLMINGINTSEEAFLALLDFCAGLNAHVNLLPMNSVPGSAYKAVSADEMQKWATRLEAEGINASVRTSRGSDIFGACGQLKNMRAD